MTARRASAWLGVGLMAAAGASVATDPCRLCRTPAALLRVDTWRGWAVGAGVLALAWGVSR